MRELDETDLEILRLLVEDARRPYSEIADAVGLSPPTVSDRVDRLREVGVVKRFTADIDRSLLSEGTQVLVEADIRPGRTAEVQRALDAVDGVEHVFRTVDGRVTFKGTFAPNDLEETLADVLGTDAVRSYEARLLADATWDPRPGGVQFALECVECGNTVTSEGASARIGGELYQFCCSSCRGRFEDRYEELESGA